VVKAVARVINPPKKNLSEESTYLEICTYCNLELKSHSSKKQMDSIFSQA
jgi:hypothetical protein